MIEVAGIPVVELMDSRSPCLDIAVGLITLKPPADDRGDHRPRPSPCRYLGARLDERTIIKQKGYEQAMLDAGMTPYSVMVGNPRPILRGLS